MASKVTEVLGIKVGEFFYRSWGYDQTNIDYYQVVGFSPSGKSVKLRHVRKTVEGNGVVPLKGNWVTGGWVRDENGSRYDRELAQPVLTRPIRTSGYTKASVPLDGDYLFHWDNRPMFDTTALGYPGH